MSTKPNECKTAKSTRLVVTMPTDTAVEFQTLCHNAKITQQAWIRNVINRSIVVNRGGLIPEPEPFTRGAPD